MTQNNQPFADAAGSFTGARFAHPKGEKEDEFWVCGGETSDLHKTEGFSKHRGGSVF